MKTSENKPSEGLPEIDQLNYDQAFNELEQIVAALEVNERPLEEALSLYERGQALAKHCAQLLDQAELKVKQLSGEELIDFTPP